MPIDTTLNDCDENSNYIDPNNNSDKIEVNNNNEINVKPNIYNQISLNDSLSIDFDIGDFNEDNLYYPDPIRSWLAEDANLAVRARNVCYTYGSGTNTTCVLNNLSISVPVGTIYGLLGPSGCGKTTLLGIISGLMKPESGLVKVFGQTPGSRESGMPGSALGYMPQDTALQTDLTVYETLWYFGRLFFIPTPVLNKRIEKLIEMLDIPCPNKLVSSLSGGQSRRVSLACSIIHRPRLAILDEPTCGVDPLLCHRIWQLMYKFSSEENMTIIITTHYIEECRKAGIVGFMRAGEILEEDSPQALMDRYQTASLEQMFYKICFSQKRRNTIIRRRLSSKGPTIAPDDKQRDFNSPYKSHRVSHPIHSFFSSIYTLTWRYLMQSLRSPIYILLLFVFPICSLAIMYICVGHSPFDVPIGWVTDDPSDYSGLHVRESNYSIGWQTHRIPYYPQELYDAIDHKVLKIIKYSSLEDAITDVRSLKLKCVVHMRQFFSASFHDRVDMFSQKSVETDTISRGTIWVFADLSDQFMLTTVTASIELALLKIFNSTAPAFNSSYIQRQLPVAIGDPVEGGIENMFKLNVSEYLTPGLIVSTIFACAFAISSLALISESKDKMFVRNYATGLSAGQIVFSQIISRFIFLSVNGVLFLFVSVFIFGIPCRGSIFIAIFLIWLQALAGCATGMLFGSMFPDFESALYVSLGTFVFITSISGLFWPIEALPYYIKPISFISPFTEAAIALRNVMMKENQNQVNIQPGITTSVAWIWAMMLGSTLFLQRRVFAS